MGSGNENVNVSNDQEMAQSERKCHSKRRGGKVYVDNGCLLEIAAKLARIFEIFYTFASIKFLSNH